MLTGLQGTLQFHCARDRAALHDHELFAALTVVIGRFLRIPATN